MAVCRIRAGQSFGSIVQGLFTDIVHNIYLSPAWAGFFAGVVWQVPLVPSPECAGSWEKCPVGSI